MNDESTGADAPKDEKPPRADGRKAEDRLVMVRPPMVRWRRFGEHGAPEEGIVLTVDKRGRHLTELYYRNGTCQNAHGDLVLPQPTYWVEIGADIDSDVEPKFEFEWFNLNEQADTAVLPEHADTGGPVVGVYREKPALRVVEYFPERGWVWHGKNVDAPDWWGKAPAIFFTLLLGPLRGDD